MNTFIHPIFKPFTALAHTACALALCSSAHATDYYVSPTGDDSNSGLTIDSPLKTIAAASAKLQPGDHCYVRGGTYREILRPEVSGTSALPITYSNYQDEEVIISTADPLSGWTQHDGNI